MLAYVVTVSGLGVLLSAARAVPALASDDDRRRLRTSAVELGGLGDYRASLARSMRVVRWVGVLLVLIRVVMYRSSGASTEHLPVWVVVVVIGGGLVTINTMSLVGCDMGRSGDGSGWSPWRMLASSRSSSPPSPRWHRSRPCHWSW